MFVLLVEDEVLIAMHTEAVLAQLGFADVRRAASVTRGFAMLADGAPQLALLDMDLDGADVFPLAAALRLRGSPVVFLGARSDLPPEWTDAPVAAKPVERAELARIVSVLTAQARTPRPSAPGPNKA